RNYRRTLTVSGGVRPLAAFTVTDFSGGTTGLPAGAITINAAAGTITINGAPSDFGTAGFTVTVIDQTGATLTQDLSLIINPPPQVTDLTAVWTAGKAGFTGIMHIGG